jgi:hypothetical protein
MCRVAGRPPRASGLRTVTCPSRRNLATGATSRNFRGTNKVSFRSCWEYTSLRLRTGNGLLRNLACVTPTVMCLCGALSRVPFMNCVVVVFAIRSVSIAQSVWRPATGWTFEGPEFESSSPRRPDGLWGPPSLLSNVYLGLLFLWG